MDSLRNDGSIMIQSHCKTHVHHTVLWKLNKDVVFPINSEQKVSAELSELSEPDILDLI